MKTSQSNRFIFGFDQGTDGGAELLGGKGLGLAEMTAMGIRVPHGFTITTDACRSFIETRDLPGELEHELDEHIRRLEQQTRKVFGSAADPLLVSVRSGAAVSMPGMMDTILNVGLNDETTEGLANRTGNARFAFDSYRRLIQMFGQVVDGIEAHMFEEAMANLKKRRGVVEDTELSADDMRDLAQEFSNICRAATGAEFPQQPRVQLLHAIRAVFESWESPRAAVYRRAHHIPDNLGTAVNVVQMVFGNKGERSGTGVAFTRNPSTGDRALYGEFLIDAQGEDVVGGIRTPQPLEAMEELLPGAFGQLLSTMRTLETHYRDVQDIEFTIEDETLYLLQTRTAKRTAPAALRAAVAMVDEGLITRDDAILRIDPRQLDQLLHPTLDPGHTSPPAAIGLAASPGAAAGRVALTTDRAKEYATHGQSAILVRHETTPDDIEGMIAASGVLTATGGLTSHAAVVARGMGKPCVVGCEEIGRIDLDYRHVTISDQIIAEGTSITIDGGTGRVFLEDVELVAPKVNADFETILEWSDETRRLEVRANADTPSDAVRAREFGAQGIGLCRTEHMFFGEERLPIVQKMILADNETDRRAALDCLLPFQQSDFQSIFEAMAELPVTIRLLDPPLHEFLPRLEETRDEKTRARIRELHEANPMLGTRGCRLGLQFPEIYEMQVRAIARAARAVRDADGSSPIVEIMHPLIGFSEELVRLRDLTMSVWCEEASEIPLLVGTMIEVPRAALRADEIALAADFFSFGTNDLTQTTLALSRDDAEGKFLSHYLQAGVLRQNPFQTLDTDGVGDLMRIAVQRGRDANAELKLGICGEHGGDPRSIAFCHELGLGYVSCSAYRVPLARLAAAQAALQFATAVSGAPEGTATSDRTSTERSVQR
jgi:pyruvate,orthophosphate dikinase